MCNSKMDDDGDEMQRFMYGGVGFSMYPSMKRLIVVDNVLVPECLKDSVVGEEKVVIIQGDALVPKIHDFFANDGKEIPEPSDEEKMIPLEEWILDVLREISHGRDPNLKLWPLKHPSSTGDVPPFTRCATAAHPSIPADVGAWFSMIQKLTTHQTGAP